DVHRVVLGCPHRWLDLSVEGNDRGPAPEDRAPAPALYRCHAARLRADLAPEVAGIDYTSATAAVPLLGDDDGRSVIHRDATGQRGRPWRVRCRRRAPRALSIGSP